MRDEKNILGIDSLRFIAFLCVFICHAVPSFKYGAIGMDFFFVLSSFLLTYLALKEIKNTNHFSKINFFIRRGLRIYPLYYLILLFAFFVLPVLAEHAGQTVTLPSRKYLYFFFVSNYDLTDHIFALKFLWSLSVEEQFYILFIFLSFFFKERMFFLVGMLILIFVVETAIGLHFNWFQYTNTFFYFPHFAAGMVAAKLYFENKIPSGRQLSLMFFCLVAVTLIFIVTPVIENFRNIPLSFSLASVLLLTIVTFRGNDGRNWLLRVLEFLGRYIYGLYVYSGFVITLAIKKLAHVNVFGKVMLELFVLIIIAWLSYHFYEKPFLKLKRLFRRATI